MRSHRKRQVCPRWLLCMNESCTPILPDRYQTAMLRALKEVRADDSVVGFYQSTTMGAFFSQTLVDTQAIHREKLRHGGIVVVHGTIYLSCTGARTDDCFVLHQMYLSVIEEMPLSAHSNFQKTSSMLTTRPHSVSSRELPYFLLPLCS